MQASLHSFFKVRETKPDGVDVGTGSGGHLPYQTDPGKAKTLPVFKGMTYNVEILTDVRVNQILAFMRKDQVDFCTLIGTRSDSYYSCHAQDYHLYHFPKGGDGTESYTGVTIIVSSRMLTGSRVAHKSIEPGRLVFLRLINKQWDLTIVGAYSPGNHLPESRFYKLLRGYLRGLPARTIVFLGIDSNAHIGPDATSPTFGNNSPSPSWNDNGRVFHDCLLSTDLIALNTLSSCAGPDWTWQRRDSGEG